MKQFVKDLKEKDKVNSVFLAKGKLERKDRNGKTFLNLDLQDVSGTINARVWEGADQFTKLFDSGDCVQIKGFVQVYQNKKQIIVNDLVRAQKDHFEIEDIFTGDKKMAQDAYDEIFKYVSRIKDAHLKELMELCLKDGEVKPLLLKAPAAKTIHHAYIGGLLDHVLSICKIMDFLSQHYKFLNYDFLIFGAIFHDIGKIWELSVDEGIKYTDRGRLVGHMTLACELIDAKAIQIEGFPLELKDILKHIILSHHGRLEYGSPKRPKFLEAQIVAMVDEMDSKIASMSDIMENETKFEGKWSNYNEHYERYLFLDLFREMKKENK